MTTEPTDAEIWQMWMPMVRRMGVADPVEFARAVLAKWGTPQTGAGEHKPGCPALGGYGHGVEACCCGATPQPTQAQAGAVPLTDEQIQAMLNKHPPEDVCGWSYRMGIDDAELHHGIKGGQHGTDN